MRSRLRVISAVIAAVLAAVSSAQTREGVYKPAGGPPASWRINDHHALIWNGEPYVPIGLRVDGQPAAIKVAAERGIRDVIVDLPANGAGWKEAFAELENHKLRYLIRIDSLAPMARGYAVEPQAYRVAGISKPRTVTVSLPGATSAFTVVASRRDSSIASSGPVRVEDGKLTTEVKPGGEIEHVLLLYPEWVSLDQPDFWEAFDEHRDGLLASLRRSPPGPGFRGLVNPLGRTLELPGRELRFVPTSAIFRLEFREALERKYSSIVTAMRAWGMGTNSVASFDELARLVPLWQGSRGVGLFLDPSTGRTMAADTRNNTVWRDLSEVVSAAGTRRFDRFVRAIRTVTDVPVVQEWAGWAAPYESPTPTLDGVGMRAGGTTPSLIAETGSRAASSVMRWMTPGWLPATDVEPGSTVGAAGQIPGVVEDLLSMGARAIFVRSDVPEVQAAVKAEAQQRTDTATLAESSPRPIFFPENAANPAAVQRLPGNAWWLPAPSDGNRIDLGPDFFCYRMRQQDVGDALAIWARTPGRYKLRMLDNKEAAFATLDGSDANPRKVKGGVEVNLTEFPILMTGSTEVAVPEAAYESTLKSFDALLQAAEAERRDTAEERVPFKEAVAGFDRNPGGNFALMRVLLNRLGSRVGTTTWIEAERTSDTNFGEAATFGGCSAGAALTLRTPMSAGEDGYFADYRVAARTTGEQTIWIAAKMGTNREPLTVQIGGQTSIVRGEPIGLYGDGFGWYRVAKTRLAPGTVTLRVSIPGTDGADVAVDAIVLTPTDWQPTGVVSRPNPIG